MLSAVFHWIGFGLCHQLPERSLFAAGFQLPVCARDTGIYAGFVLSLVFIAVLERGRRPSELAPRWILVLGALFFGTMVLDGVSSYAGWRGTTNDLRLITGLLAGYSLPLVVTPMLNGQMWTRVSGRPLLEGWRGLVWVATVPLSFALLKWVLPLTGVVYPLLLTLAIVATYAVVNMIFVTLIPPLEHKMVTLVRAPVQITLALLLVAAEIGFAAALRIAVERLTSGL